MRPPTSRTDPRARVTLDAMARICVEPVAATTAMPTATWPEATADESDPLRCELIAKGVLVPREIAAKRGRRQ